MQIFTLSEATVFPDYNKKQGKEAHFALKEIPLQTLKYKHFRDIMKYPEVDQMHRLMLAMTGLSEEDLGELLPTDAAGISRIIFKSMSQYFELGKEIMGVGDK